MTRGGGAKITLNILNLCLIYRIRKHRKKRRGVDYNAEIPFEKKPAQGTKNAKNWYL